VPLDLYPEPNFRGVKYTAPVGGAALLFLFNDRARSCRSSGISELWSDPNFMGINYVLMGTQNISWLGTLGLDLNISSTRTTSA
jgi:hypothetical protein